MRPCQRFLLSVFLCAGGCDSAEPEPPRKVATPATSAQPTATENPTKAAEPKPDPEPKPESKKPAVLHEVEIEGDGDTWTVPKEQTGPAGVGITVSGLAKQGWSRLRDDDRPMILAGPPGGPLGFSVYTYGASKAEVPLTEYFQEIMGDREFKPGKPETVAIAGADRDAHSFESGEGLSHSAWCVIRVPAEEGATRGFILVADSGLSTGEKATCAAAFGAPAMAPVVKNWKLVP